MNPSERLLKQFRELVTVRLGRINRSLMELEAGANLEAGRRVLRELHGLKGEARMMGFDDINALVHQMEELVRCAEPNRYVLSAESTDALLTAADAVLALSGAHQTGEPPPEVGALVATLQECIEGEAERLPPSARPVPGADAVDLDEAGEGARAGTLAQGPLPREEPRAATSVPPKGEPGASVSARTAPGGAPARSDEDALGTVRSSPPPSGTGTPPVAGGPPAAGHLFTAGGAGPSPRLTLGGATGALASHVLASAAAGAPGAAPGSGQPAGAPGGPGHVLTAAPGLPALSGAGASSAPRAPLSDRDGKAARGTAGAGAASASATGAEAMARMPAPGGRASGAAPQRFPESRADTSIRIGVASLDVLTSAVTNLTQVARRRELANARRLALARELSQLAREAEDLGPAAASLVARLGHAKELAATLHREAKLLSNQELRDLGQVAEEVQGLRMLPLSVLFEPYPRMVRDLSRELGKEVELVIDGEDTRADRAVVEALREPLMHLVRNALDHGLETRVDRVAAGKHPRGCLTLRAAREGNRIVLRVEDDGLGLDPASLRQVAVRKGFLDESAANALSDAAARELIFLSGFTSREVVTDLSGRGVGLDAVRTSIQGLGGDVGVESAPGWGTIFELRVPVSLTVAPLLFVQVGEETLALSATHVSRALKVDAGDVGELAGRPTLSVEGGVLPFAPLASVLGLAPERPAREGELVLVVKSQGVEAALAVDRVLEERVQAILPLKGLLSRFSHLTGATMLADGRLAMVLAAAYLTAVAHGTSLLKLPRVQPRTPGPRRRRILVVDDSPLTRELLSNLLEAVGYDTLMAADGDEAQSVLEGMRDSAGVAAPVDLVVTDLEMPRVDGLELTRLLKGHPEHARLPVVILTTRGGEEDRKRGLAAGADGYITKGDLVRQDLVDVVGRLLG